MTGSITERMTGRVYVEILVASIFLHNVGTSNGQTNIDMLRLRVELRRTVFFYHFPNFLDMFKTDLSRKNI
jgi:hypothetical protein